VCRSPLLPTKSDDQVAGIFEHVGAQQLFRGGNCCRGLFARQSSDGAEWIEAQDKADFGFEDVADSGEDRLIEQDVCQRFVSSVKQARKRSLGVEIRNEHIVCGLSNVQIARQ
jgi:hypothetical protein